MYAHLQKICPEDNYSRCVSELPLWLSYTLLAAKSYTKKEKCYIACALEVFPSYFGSLVLLIFISGAR